LLPLPIEYFIVIIIISIIAAFMVGATAYGALNLPLCPLENPDCSADVVFARLLGMVLAVVIVAGGFATLIYFLVKRGRRMKDKYAVGISLPEEQKGKVNLFVGDSWLKEVLIILGLNLVVVALPNAILPSYLSFPLWIAVAWLPILAIRRKTANLFKGQRWQTELVVVLILLIVVGVALRKVLELPYSLPAEVGAVVIAVWLIRANSMKYRPNQQTIDGQR
jgi:hypothetical protein